MRDRFTLRVAVALLAVMSVAAGCGSGSPTTAGGGPSAAGSDQVARRDGPPAGTDASPITQGRGEAVLTDQLLVVSASEEGRCGVTARALADVRTIRWTYQPGPAEQLACTTGSLLVAGSTIVMAYSKETPAQGVQPASFERGLVAISSDGKAIWHASAGKVNDVAAANDRFAVGWVNRDNTSFGYLDSSTEASTVVVDVASGRVLWQRAGVTAVGLDGDLVYVVDDTTKLNLDDPHSLYALDAATGTQRWSATAVAVLDVAFVGGGMVVLDTSRKRTNDFGNDATVTIRNGRTGDIQHEELNADTSNKCVSDGQTAVVCQSSGDGSYSGHVFAFDLKTGKRTWEILAPAARETKTQIRSMVDGRLFVWTSTGGAILDAVTGRQVSANLKAAPDLIRGAYGVFYRDNQFELYRVTT